jgi:tetratricopeptide (TPR) repeat protein
MSSHAKRTFLACSLIVAVATLTSCSNKVEEETSDLRRDKAAGRYQTAYNRAEQIIASKSEYSPESVAYAESVIKETKTILTAHYGGNIRAQVASGNIDTALGMWSEIREKDPELVADDFDLARRMMRVYARQSLWDRATEVAEDIRSRATNEVDREDAEKFLQNLANLRESKSRADSLFQQVSHLEDELEIDLSGGILCGAANTEKMSDEDRQLLQSFEQAQLDIETNLSELLAFTNTLPAAVVAPQSLDDSES